MNNESLKHYGVKGMKWGVIRNRVRPSNIKKAVSTRIKEEVKSAKRETGWRKELEKIHKLDSKSLRSKVERIRMENDLKRLSKNQKLRTYTDHKQKSKDMKTYRNREQLSDKQLRSKVETLRLKDQLRREISKASAKHREVGKQLVDNAKEFNPAIKPYADYGKSMIDYAYGAYD